MKKTRKRMYIIESLGERLLLCGIIFLEVEVGGVIKNQCKWCKGKFTKSKSSSTTTLSRHLETCFKYIGSKKKQKVLSIDASEADGVSVISNFNYDESK
jgi:hypothetical protein